MTGISYTSSFILILSLSLISADLASDSLSNTAETSTTPDDSTTELSALTSTDTAATTADTTSSNTAETSITPDHSTTELSALTSTDPAATTADTTSSNTAETSTTPDDSTTELSALTSTDTAATTADTTSSNTAETSTTPDHSTTELSALTSTDPAATTADTTDSSNTAETSTTPDDSTTELSALTSTDTAATTVDTTDSSNTAETSTTPDDSTTELSALTSTDPAATTADTTSSNTAETSTTPDDSTTELSALTSTDPAATTADTTSSNTAETSTTPDDSTTELSALTSTDPAATTADTTSSNTAETSTAPDDSTTELSALTSTDPAATTADTTSSNTAETSTAPDDSTTELSAVTSTDTAATTVDTTLVTEDSAPTPASTTADFTTTKEVITTRTSSTQSTSKTTTVKPIHCENGGTPQSDNKACLCPKGFTGSYCNTVVTQIVPDVLERTVDITMEINEKFTDDHTNPSSDAYQDFLKRFNETVVNSYEKEIPNFLRVENIILSAGGPLQRSQRRKRSSPLKETISDTASLKVEHDILLNIENDKNPTDTYEKIVKNVAIVLDGIKNNPDSGLVLNKATASETDLNVKEVCIKATEGIPEEYQKYYEAVPLGGKVECVTPCNGNHKNAKICKNSGTCEVSSQGPSCYCPYNDDLWYLGADCSLQVHKIGFYAGLGSVAAMAVLTVAFLTAYLIINKRTVKRNKDIKQELVKEWLEDDFEWPPQKKTSYTADRYDNPVYSPGGRHTQDSFGNYKPYFSANQSYTQNFSPEPSIDLRYIQRDQFMKMDRPQIRSSFET
ncbi:mucin-3A isoform X24 [Carassius gibelio]|uniref:mucin-3A isoform X24 n=1 Tax=Carassius gibelio TaxID=101364 RepID=UPI0022781089|nr:mucin-3A isoform X24 [Carassius gibelio]